MAPVDSGQSHVAGQSPDRWWLIWRRNFWGWVTVIVVAVICFVIVKVFKKPGQMSVLESQAMDMTAMTPPLGAVPVAIATVERKPVEATVIYTGTVQAFEDEDIYPRVTGRIVSMPVYPGDRVRKGELLLQLDPKLSEYQARLNEATHEAEAQEHNTSIATEEFREKEYDYKAAVDGERAASRALSAAKADLDYWTPELARQKDLYEKQVVSLDEYQLELSKRDHAKARYEEAQATLGAAASRKVAAQAAYDAMTHHVVHQKLLASKAADARQNAALYEQYTRIRAKDEAVVIKRLISPGVVVSPGMLILKLARVRQVRVQAEVSEEDASKIKLGDRVFIKGSGSEKEVQAKVTAVFPAADPTVRTFIVESLIDNVKRESGRRGASPEEKRSPVSSITDYCFLPGQYVVMRISAGQSQGLAIPTSAIIWSEGKAHVWTATGGTGSGGNKSYSCLMHPEVVSDKPGDCPKCGMPLEEKVRGGRQVAHYAEIVTGLSNPDFTEVKSGLKAGEQVISAGYENLSPGTAVVATEWGSSGPLKLPSADEVSGNRLDSGNNWSLEQSREALRIHMSLTPSPPRSGDNQLSLQLTTDEGSPLKGASVSGKTSMPAMKMSGPNLSGTADSAGRVTLKSNLSSGPWRVELQIALPSGKSYSTSVDIEVP